MVKEGVKESEGGGGGGGDEGNRYGDRKESTSERRRRSTAKSEESGPRSSFSMSSGCLEDSEAGRCRDRSVRRRESESARNVKAKE